ncbi:MAG: zinc ribbon domain-containing protein [Synechococcaceae cyanobacterium SM2_3_2]|nr:zinc ribbon domain-containing protein [Synechococcaceae cyanobacterium SM2_3_2]
MPYQCTLSSGQHIYLDNPGHQTVITVASGSAGQQQQSSSSVSTGPWTAVPQVAQMNGGALIRCVTAQGTFTFQVQGMQVSTATDASNWQAAQQIALQTVDTRPGTSMPPMMPMQPMPPIAPMPPMKPMQMGDMQMSANPMAMRMGNMAMQMGHAMAETAQPRQFCTQCGAPVGPEDRFCGSCGHKLGD